MLTLKFYAGADDAPARLPVRVLPGVTDVRLSDEKPPRLVYSLPSPGLVSRGRDDVSYLPLTDLGPVEVFNAAGVSLAVLNAGPEVLTVPDLSAEDAAAVYSSRYWRSGGYPPAFIVDTLSPDQRRRMQGYDPGPRMHAEPCRWPVALTPPGVIDTVDAYPALALALQSEGYSFGSLTKGFGWWFGKWAEAALNGECGAADTLREAVLAAEEHYRDRAEREPGEVGAAMRTRAGTILERAHREDGLRPHRPLHARRIPLDLARAGDQSATITLHADDGTSALKVEGGNAVFTGGLHVDESAFLGTSTEGLSPALIDAGYTLQRSENASNAWRWRKGEAQSDWFNGEDARDRCIAELTRQVFGPRCACGEPVGQPHRSDCGAAAFVGDNVRSDQADIADLSRPLEGTNDTPEPAPTVPFFVDGEQYDTPAGVRSGRALYDRVGGLSGMMLVDPAGQFVGDTDLVDIQGGELFATTTYRDDTKRAAADPAVPPGHVVVTLNGITKAVDPAHVSFVDDLWRVLQLSPTSGLKVNKPGQVTRPLPDPNAAYKLEKGDAFESYLCERRFSRAAPVQVTVDGSERLLTPGVYERAEIDVLFGCAGWDLTQNGKPVERGASVTVGLGDRFSTDIPF